LLVCLTMVCVAAAAASAPRSRSRSRATSMFRGSLILCPVSFVPGTSLRRNLPAGLATARERGGGRGRPVPCRSTRTPAPKRGSHPVDDHREPTRRPVRPSATRTNFPVSSGFSPVEDELLRVVRSGVDRTGTRTRATRRQSSRGTTASQAQ
jgi:hypothetical protein